MATMDIDQCLAGDQTKPDENRSRRVHQKMINPLHGRQPCFLQDIVRIDSSVKTRVHAKGDHSPQSITMLGKQLGECILVAVGHQFNQLSF